MGAHQLMGYGGQDICPFMQLLPYMLQTGILILFAVLFCCVSRILDGADGLPATAYRAR